MHRFGRTLSITGLILIAGCSQLKAQDVSPVRISAHIGYETGRINGTAAVYDGSPLCGEFSNGHTEGIMLGIGVGMPNVLGANFGLHARLFWVREKESFTSPLSAQQAVLDREEKTVVYLEREYRLNLSRNVLRVDLPVYWQATSSLLLSLGPSLDITTGMSVAETDNILGPDDFRFADGSTEQPLIGGTQFTSTGIVPAITAGVAYQIPLWNGQILVPELSVRADVGSPVNEAVLRRFTVGFGMNLVYDIVQPEVPSPPPPPLLNASVDLYVVDADGEHRDSTGIAVHRTLHRRFTPFLPVVFFDSASIYPASRYRTLVRNETQAFMIDSSERHDPIALNHHVLDIIGQRMLADTSATIALLGRRSSEESSGIMGRRVNEVRRYLHDTWGIDEKRVANAEEQLGLPLASEATPDGKSENRRVEVISTTPGLLGPMASEQLVHEFKPPVIGMTPAVQAEAGVRHWEIVVRYGDREVQRYTSEDRQAQNDIAWNLVAEQVRPAATPLSAELIVEDSTSRKTIARDSIMLSLQHAMRGAEGEQSKESREILQRRIAGFGYGSAEPGERARTEVEELSQLVQSGAVITVAGVADRLGETRFNRELSRLRAMMVASIIENTLKTNGVMATVNTAAGKADEIQAVAVSPEERMLMRGVVITVEQDIVPVK